MAYNLKDMAKQIAQEAWQESDGDIEYARIYATESCEGNEVSIYYGRAICFCSDVNTDAGESFLEDFGGIAQIGDSFGTIACRIAYATLYVAVMAELDEIEKES